MSTNLYSSFLVALAAAATAVVTGCAAGEAADDANAVALPLQSTSLPSREITPCEDNEPPSGYASGQRFEENPYPRAGGEERGSSVYISIAYSQGSNGGSQIGAGAPQGSYGQPQQGQYEPPQQGQSGQPQQGQPEELPDDMQGGGVAGAYGEPVGGDVPVPVPQVVPYPVFVPTFVGYTLPMWGSLYGVGCYPYGGAFLSPRFWGLMF